MAIIGIPVRISNSGQFVACLATTIYPKKLIGILDFWMILILFGIVCVLYRPCRALRRLRML